MRFQERTLFEFLLLTGGGRFRTPRPFLKPQDQNREFSQQHTTLNTKQTHPNIFHYRHRSGRTPGRTTPGTSCFDASEHIWIKALRQAFSLHCFLALENGNWKCLRSYDPEKLHGFHRRLKSLQAQQRARFAMNSPSRNQSRD